MSQRPIGLTIFFWLEVILSGRILLFTIPVFINKQNLGNAPVNSLDDKFLVLLSLAAVVYLIIGILSATGAKFYKMLHVLGAMIIAALFFGLFISQLGELALAHYLPIVFAVLFAMIAQIAKS